MKQPFEMAELFSRPQEASDGFFVRHGLVIVLMLTYAVATMDRQILAILQEPIKRDLQLSDGQLGLLTGFSFVVFYSLFGMVFGMLVDRFSRRLLIAISMISWSAMTALTGAAQSFAFILAARIGVAIGEAGVVPASASIISGRYAAEHRAGAMSFLFVAVPLGMLAGFYLGGRLEHAVGWRMTFMLAGIPGGILAVGVQLFVREPARTVVSNPIRLGEGLRLLARSRTLRGLALAAPLSGLVSVAMNTWGASYLIRSHGMSVADVGTVLGLAFGVGGAVGSFGTGLLADRLATRDLRWYLWLLTLISAIMAPLIVASLTASNSATAVFFLILPCAFGVAFSGLVVSVLNVISPPQFRGTATALSILIGNIGTGVGAWLIGATSDLLAPTFGTASIKYALLIIVPAVAILAAIQYARAARSLPEELSRGE
jgi:predicted MFS family arabinose efflux permease